MPTEHLFAPIVPLLNVHLYFPIPPFSFLFLFSSYHCSHFNSSLIGSHERRVYFPAQLTTPVKNFGLNFHFLKVIRSVIKKYIQVGD